MTATGSQFLAHARSRLGWGYKVDAGRLTGTNRTTDCSGLVYLALNDLGIVAPTDSSTQARWCRDHNLDRIDRDLALRTPGCLGFKGAAFGYDGIGPMGHVAITSGDGRNVVEAKGSAFGVVEDPYTAGSHPFVNWAYVPGLLYLPVGDPLSPEVHVNWLIAAHPKNATGYWCCNSAGQVYAYGVGFYGGRDHMPKGTAIVGHITDISPTASGRGYYLVNDSGQVYAFGDASAAGDPHGDPKT